MKMEKISSKLSKITFEYRKEWLKIKTMENLSNCVFFCIRRCDDHRRRTLEDSSFDCKL